MEGRGSLWPALFGIRKFRMPIQRMLRKLKFREAGLSNSQKPKKFRSNFLIRSYSTFVFIQEKNEFYIFEPEKNNRNKIIIFES